MGILATKWLEQSSAETFDFMGDKRQAIARAARVIRKNWGLTCAFSWASHKITALHKENRRGASLALITDEIDRNLQIVDNPHLLG